MCIAAQFFSTFVEKLLELFFTSVFANSVNLVFATRVLCLLIGGHRCCFHHHQLHDQLFTTYSAKRQQPTECSVPYKIRVNIPICGERSYIESLLNTSAPVGSPSLVILLPKKG